MTKNELSTKIVLKHVHQVLKPLGYKKMGKRFFKYINDIIFLIDVQKTVYGTKDDTSITVNVGIYSRVLAKATFHYESETPPYYICHYHERIGMFTDKKKDKWWDLG
ncbi:MAG TPA: DUF4304 domain-containing protein, partial [Candidatus Nitrosocosmicus sp.]|nr:DUF4304 domain-containing protein [Candidatus Nitrosocosmicus sp.]